MIPAQRRIRDGASWLLRLPRPELTLEPTHYIYIYVDSYTYAYRDIEISISTSMSMYMSMSMSMSMPVYQRNYRPTSPFLHP